MKEVWREIKGSNLPSFMACIDNKQPRLVKDKNGHLIPNKKRKSLIVQREDLQKYGILEKDVEQ